MNYSFRMESVLFIITAVLCSILLLKLLYTLRTILPWRVNCWFCNNNFWVKYPDRNCWTCPKCEQYNGFTKDGDYNKPLFASPEQARRTPRVFQRSPPRNGLCKMCNINQQLKVTQLANFVPMSENKYDEEIDTYRMQLEKAYKLCSPCKKVLQVKLYKEKETLLGTKLLEARTPEKKNRKQEMQHGQLQSFVNNTTKFIVGILFILILVEIYRNVAKHKHLPRILLNVNEIISSLLERLYTIVKVKLLMTFPELERASDNIRNILDIDALPKLNFTQLDSMNKLSQEVLGGLACSVQIIGLIWNANKLTHTILIDLLLSVFTIVSIAHNTVVVDPIIMSLVKLTSIGGAMAVLWNKSSKTVKTIRRMPVPPMGMKNLTSSPVRQIEDEDISMDTDDDVSLSKYGLRDFSDSSRETTMHHSSLINGRSFTPRINDSLWTKPKLNSSFCVNPVLSKSASSVSETVFIKPRNSYNKYQKFAKDDSDSDLDESISSLCIGSPKKAKSNGSIFSLRKFTATPNFIAPTPLTRPLISPSKLGHSTSWVAGGYWGSEGERQILSVNGSRSSSQSSGFESQASSLNQRNMVSQPSSREESVCGDPIRPSMLDPFQSCNSNSYNNYNVPQNFSRMSSPVFPQMQFNSHVQIPQPRFAQQSVSHNVFAQHQYVQNSKFKTPGTSGLIKLPQSTSFASR